MKSDTTNCPYCMAEEQPVSNRPSGAHHDGWRCGTRRFLPENIRTDLCREREERDKLQKKLDALGGFFYRAMQIVEGFRVTLETVTEGDVECKQLKELREDIEAYAKANKTK
jgi:hypothetical protein